MAAVFEGKGSPYRARQIPRLAEHPALRMRRRVSAGAGWLMWGVLLEIPIVYATRSAFAYAAFAVAMACAVWLFTTPAAKGSRGTRLTGNLLRVLAPLLVVTALASATADASAALSFVCLRGVLPVLGLVFVASRLRDLGQAREARKAWLALLVLAVCLVGLLLLLVLLEEGDVIAFVIAVQLVVLFSAYGLVLTSNLRDLVSVRFHAWWFEPSRPPSGRWVLLLRARDGHAEIISGDREVEHFGDADLALARLLDAGCLPAARAQRETRVARGPALAP